MLSASFEQYSKIIQKYHQQLTDEGLIVDYLELYNDKLQAVRPTDKHLVVLAAVYVGKARLLDNLEIELPVN